MVCIFNYIGHRVEGRTEKTKGKDGREGQTERTDGKDGRKGRTERTDGKDGRKGRTERTDRQKGRTDGRKGRTDGKDGRKGQTERMDEWMDRFFSDSAFLCCRLVATCISDARKSDAYHDWSTFATRG